ncbi:MAG TPA: flagellar filament capping protein FliD [Burkholderiaceae bacterium]
MSTSISGTGSVSSAGIGSGLDVSSIISKLMEVEKAPLTALQTKETSIQSTISTYGTLKSDVSDLRDAARTLIKPSTWSATTGTSSDATSVSVATGTNAATGNYSVQVQSLAAAQSTVSGTFSSADALVGSGTLHIDLGTWATGNASFTAKSGSSGVDITVSATDTLTTLADKITASSAGVNASVVTDASGSRLVLTSKTTGVDNAFRITAVDSDGANTDASGLSALAYDPAGGTTATTSTQSAANAKATINGLSVTSATNTLTDVIKGLTLTLNKVTTGPVQIGIAQDTSSIKTAVQSFVTAYNALSSLLSTDLKYDSSTSTAGPLQGDASAQSLQRQLRNLISGSSGGSSTFATLSSMGLEIQTDGTLKVNDTKLTAALANPAEMKKAFANADLNNASNNGFAQQLNLFGNSVLGGEGLLTTRIAGLNASLTRNQADQDKLQARLDATQARLTKQYNALDTKMASLTTLSNYVTQQIANWNKSS